MHGNVRRCLRVETCTTGKVEEPNATSHRQRDINTARNGRDRPTSSVSRLRKKRRRNKNTGQVAIPGNKNTLALDAIEPWFPSILMVRQFFLENGNSAPKVSPRHLFVDQTYRNGQKEIKLKRSTVHWTWTSHWLTLKTPITSFQFDDLSYVKFIREDNKRILLKIIFLSRRILWSASEGNCVWLMQPRGICTNANDPLARASPWPFFPGSFIMPVHQTN